MIIFNIVYNFEFSGNSSKVNVNSATVKKSAPVKKGNNKGILYYFILFYIFFIISQSIFK